MSAHQGQIVAMGGGGFSMEPENSLLDDFVLSLSRRQPARVCFLPTASADSPAYVAKFYRAFAGRSIPTDVTTFDPTAFARHPARDGRSSWCVGGSGCDLRWRREHRESARDLACARYRSHFEGRVARRRRHDRCQRRHVVLVSRGRDRLVRRPRGVERRPWPHRRHRMSALRW